MNAQRRPLRGAIVAVWRAAIIAAYAARPLSCAAVLQLEPRDLADPYASIDPHGFGVLGAFFVALLFALPVLWIALQQRRAVAASSPPVLRSTAVLLVLGSPMILQLTYFSAPLAWSWPIFAASALWFVAVASACLNRTATGPSIHGAFDRNPRAAWAVVGLIAAAKLAILPVAIPDWREILSG